MLNLEFCPLSEIQAKVRICPHFHTFLCKYFSFLNARISVKTSLINTKLGDSGGGEGVDRGGSPGNRGREGYGRRERKGREAEVLRGREAGEKCKTIRYNTSKTRTQNIFDLHLTSSR